MGKKDVKYLKLLEETFFDFLLFYGISLKTFFFFLDHHCRSVTSTIMYTLYFLKEEMLLLKRICERQINLMNIYIEVISSHFSYLYFFLFIPKSMIVWMQSQESYGLQLKLYSSIYSESESILMYDFSIELHKTSINSIWIRISTLCYHYTYKYLAISVFISQNR